MLRNFTLLITSLFVTAFVVSEFTSPVHAIVVAKNCPALNKIEKRSCTTKFGCAGTQTRFCQEVKESSINTAWDWSSWGYCGANGACQGTSSSCAKPNSLCLRNGSSYCVNTMTNENFCGGCSSGYKCPTDKPFCLQGTCIAITSNSPTDQNAPIACPSDIKKNSATSCSSAILGKSGTIVHENSNQPSICKANGEKCSYTREECMISTNGASQWCLMPGGEIEVCKPDTSCSGAVPKPTPVCTKKCTSTKTCKLPKNCQGNSLTNQKNCNKSGPSAYWCETTTCTTTCVTPSLPPSPIPSPSPSPSPVPPSPSPSPLPSPIAACLDVLEFKSDFTNLDSAELSALKAGDQIYFCALGTGNIGEFTKAQFTVNGVVRPETTTTKPDSNYYCDLYTIPQNTYDFTVSALVYNSELGWK